MKKEDLRIVYMGTPDFAVASLRALVEGGYNVVGVITMPDKPMGRHGSVLQASAVKQYALSVGLPVLQPEKLKAEEFLDALRAWQADLQIVVAFRMLPEVVWNMPRLGTFNLHASLLPQYRGAAPINWAIINGEQETGVTTFFLTHEIDTGKIILQRRLPIAETDDVGKVHDELMTLGAGLVTETVDLILAGKAEAIPQDQFMRDAEELLCRRCPAAWTELVDIDGKHQVLKVYETEMRPAVHTDAAGTLRTDGKTYLEVAVEGGYLRLLSLQLAGKKRMPVSAFLNGMKQHPVQVE